MITKRLIQLLITLFLMACLVIIGLILFVDPNHYKDTIIKKVEGTLDREFAITGDISWRFWPRLGFDINGVTLGQAPGFTHDHNNVFAQVGEASIYIRLAPLLNKQLYVDKLYIKDADFYLARLKDGTTNWDDLANSHKKKAAEETKPADPQNARLNWAINTLSIENTYLIWNDAQKNRKITVTIQDFDSALQPDHINPIDTTLNIDVQPQNIQLTTHIKSDYFIDLANKRYRIENGHIDIKDLNLNALEKTQDISASFDKCEVDLKEEQLTLDNIKARLFSGEALINASGDISNKGPHLKGHVSLKHIDLHQLALTLGQKLDFADASAAKQLTLEANFENTATGFTMQPFSAQFDDTKISGTLSGQQSKPQLTFDFNINHLDLDRYLPSKNSSSTKAATHKTSKKSATKQTFSTAGKLHIDNLLVSGMNLRAVDMKIDAHDNIIRVAPLKTQLYGGELISTTTLNMQNATPRWDINAQLNHIDIGALMKEAAKHEKFTGQLNLSTQVTAQGLDMQSMLQSLNGNAKFNVDNGELNNIDLGYWLAVGDSMIVSARNLSTLAISTAEAAAGKSNTRHTAFKEMSGTFAINQGIAQNNDLKVYSETFYALGKGQVDLPKQHVDYNVAVSSATKKVGVYQPSGPQIPLKISGPLKDPHVGIDPAGIQKLLMQAIEGNIKSTLIEAINPLGTAVGIEESVAHAITDKNTSETTNTDTNTDTSGTTNNTQSAPAPEQVVKDALKGLLGQ